MSLELDTKQELKTAAATIAEVAEIWWFAFKKVGIPDEVAAEMVQDWFRLTVLPGMAPDPFGDIKSLMNQMLNPQDEE